MHDLTEGPIPRHLMQMAAPIAIGMVFQTADYLVDLYFVAQIGDAAIAGLSSAGNVQFLVMALTQILGVGTMAQWPSSTGRSAASVRKRRPASGSGHASCRRSSCPLVVFTCSGMFQAMGNTMPSLIASASRLIAFAIPAVWLSTQPWFELRHLWYTSVVTVAFQAVFALWMLSREMKLKLGRVPPVPAAAIA